MIRKLLLFTLVGIMALSVGFTQAQDEEIPTVAILRFGPLQPFELAQKGTLDMLAAYGFVDGENINLIFGDAEFDFPTANLLVEDALDNRADVIVAITTPVMQAAVNNTLDLEDPPIVLFNTVTDPYVAGVADAACIKPDYVWGSQALAPYANIMPVLFDLNPDIEVVGYMYNNAEANSVASTVIIEEVAAELGLTLEIQTVTQTSDVGIAAEALIENGAEAFFVPTDSTVTDGLPAMLVVAEDNGIPVVHADSGQVYSDVTVGAGLSYYQEGIDTARVLIAYLNGEIDIAETGIAQQQGSRLAINLDAAALQGVEIPEALLEQADFVIENGESTEADPVLADMELEERMADDMAYVDALFCTEEIIEQQQAELDAASEE